MNSEKVATEIVKIAIEINIDIPKGATHYEGFVNATVQGDLEALRSYVVDEPIWFKATQVGGFDHWWQFDRGRNEWVLASHHKPHFIKAIQMGGAT